MIPFSRAEFNKGDDSKNVRSIIKEHVHQFSSNTDIIPHQITDISNLKCGLPHVLKSIPWTSSPSFAWVFDRGPISAIS
jgi:hypothetical protein